MFQSSGFKVFLASALGALIGSLVGLQFNHLFWWVGMLIGGIVGYVGFDVRGALNSIPIAYRQTSHQLAELWAGLVPDARVLAKIGLYALVTLGGLIALGLSWTAPFSIITNVVTNHGPSLSSFARWFMDGESSVGGSIFVAAMLNLLIGAVLVISCNRFIAYVKEVSEDVGPSWWARRYLLFLFIYANPAAWLGYWLPKGLWFVGTGLAVFSWKLFKLIHSDLRLLCGLDAAIGAGIGLAFHNPLVGAVVGGLFGLANFELVSKRWLKLVRA